MKRSSLWFTAPHQVEVRAESLPSLGPRQVLVQTHCSAISPGTELLLYRGLAPTELAADETLAALAGSLSFPLKYGYSAVGHIIARGAEVPMEWDGRRVFAFNPHESHFTATVEDVHLIPEGVEDETALFLPNMETAVNFVLDGQPRLGEWVAVVGQGVVGLLTTALLAQMSPAQLITIDPLEARRLWSVRLGATASLDPHRAHSDWAHFLPHGADLTYELSGSPEALNTAIALTGFAGRVLIGSWYGQKHTTLDLGGRFHRSRIQLISSQVSTLTPALHARWTKTRRLQVAWDQLLRVQPGRLITHRFPLSMAAQAYHQLVDSPAGMMQVIFTYDR